MAYNRYKCKPYTAWQSIFIRLLIVTLIMPILAVAPAQAQEKQEKAYESATTSIAPATDTGKLNFSKQNLPHVYNLTNGLKLLLLADNAFPYICCSSWYKVGSRDDPPGLSGLTHLVEHLLFQNEGSFSSNQLVDTIVRNGGEFSGFTSDDFTSLYINLPSNQIELAIRGQAECMREAHFSKTDVQKEITQLIAESTSGEDDLSAALNREVHALAYEQHPYRNPPGGWRHELEHLTYEEAKIHYDRYFQPNNACLVIAGNFDEQAVLKLAGKYFGVLPKSNNLPAALYPQERPQQAERRIKLKARGGKESLVVAYKVPGISDVDAPAFAVLEQLLNSPLHGRLRKLIDSGLCTTAEASFELKHDPGLFIIKCSGIANNGTAKVLQTLDDLLAQLKAKPLAESEVSQTLKQTEFMYHCDGDGAYASAFQVGFFEVLANEKEAYIWPQRLRQVGAASILQAARHYLNDDNRVVGEISACTGTNSKTQTGQNHLFQKNDAYLRDRLTTLQQSQDHSGLHLRLAAYQDSLATSQSATSAPNTQTAKTNDYSRTATSEIFHKVLKNGLNIIVIESHLQPIVYVYGAIKAGSVYDRYESRGTAKLMTAIFNNGNALTNKQQLVADQSDLGLTPPAMLKFHCRMENILFSTHCPGNDLESQLRRLFTALNQPKMQANDLDGPKNDVVISLRHSETSVEERLRRTLLSSLVARRCPYYPLHPEQEIEAINGIKLNDLQDFYRAHINPSSTTLIIAGDVESKHALAMADDLTHSWADNSNLQDTSPSNTLLKNKIASPPQLIVSNKQASKSSILLPAGTQSQVVLGRMIPVSDLRQAQAAWVALQLADCVLSGHPIFSRLGQQFEAQPELLTETGDQPWSTKILKLADNLIWSMQINLKGSTSSSAAVVAIQKELEHFAETGMPVEDLTEAKKYMAGNIPVKDCSNLEKLSHFVLHSFIELNEIDLLSRTQKILATMSTNDINQFITHMFKPQNATVIVAGPSQLIKQIQPTHESADPD